MEAFPLGFNFVLKHKLNKLFDRKLQKSTDSYSYKLHCTR